MSEKPARKLLTDPALAGRRGRQDKVQSMPQDTKMRIVGGQQVLASDGDTEELLDFYGGLFGRLAKEVRHTGDLTRYIGYQSLAGREDRLHFLGIEVDTIADIPEGMLAWELCDSTWTVWEAQGERDVLLSKQAIAWQWLARSPSGQGRYTGEFTKLDRSQAPHKRAYWVSANAYVDLREPDENSDGVHLVEYDPSWPGQFQEMANWLQKHLGPDIALRVEHYGSTSIPGMPAKPVIDVLVEIPSFAGAKARAIPLFNSEIWEYWWHSEHMTFVKREKRMGQRTHHVHMAPRDHSLWEGLAFRDYLRSHPDEASRYARLKCELASRYGTDRERYTQAKTEFVREVTSRAVRRSGCGTRSGTQG